MHPAAWEREDDDVRMARDEFVAAVLARGATSEVSSWVAERVLQPPLAWTDARPGRGVALARGRSRGSFGFTADDQSFLERLRVELAAASEVSAVGMRERAPGVERDDARSGAARPRDHRRGRRPDAPRDSRSRRFWTDSVISAFPTCTAVLDELAALASGEATRGAARIADFVRPP